MPSYAIKCWPASVSEKEIDHLPKDARAKVKFWLTQLRLDGGRSETTPTKKLKGCDGVWQLNVKTKEGQFRILYFVANEAIIVLTVYQKNSRQAQERANELALNRKREAIQKLRGDEQLTTIH